MPYKDPEKQKAAQRRHYLKNKAQYLERSTKCRRKIREALTFYVRQAKDHPCEDCGKQYPYYVMDFDHVRGKKLGDVCAMVNKAVPLERLQAEIAKCDLVCANCHRIRTFTRM